MSQHNPLRDGRLRFYDAKRPSRAFPRKAWERGAREARVDGFGECFPRTSPAPE